MKQNSYVCWFLGALGFMILILDGKTALQGASDGIELCLKTVIPALFPFFVLSSILLRCRITPLGSGKAVLRLVNLPEGAEALLIPSVLGGYPIGAKCVHQYYTDGVVEKKSAERMLAFCNNAGPAFLFGMIGRLFPQPWMPWALWGIHLTGALAAARWIHGADSPTIGVIPPQKSGKDMMAGAVSSMGAVCGWIILFRVAVAFLDRWFLWILPQTARVAVIGLLELSNGCCELAKIPDTSVRFILCSAMLAAGGLCITAQTVSVTAGLSLRHYYTGKLIQIIVSLFLSCSVAYHFPALIPGLLLLILWRSKEKRSGKPVSVVV